MKTQINKSQIFSSAWSSFKAYMKTSGVFAKNYNMPQATLSFWLKKSWAEAKEAAQPVEKFTIRLDYSEFSLRQDVKAMGGVWNADAKVWTLSCKRHQLGKLESKIVALKVSVVDSNAGFNMKNTSRNWNLVAKYGYDAIEYAD